MKRKFFYKAKRKVSAYMISVLINGENINAQENLPFIPDKLRRRNKNVSIQTSFRSPFAPFPVKLNPSTPFCWLANWTVEGKSGERIIFWCTNLKLKWICRVTYSLPGPLLAIRPRCARCCGLDGAFQGLCVPWNWRIDLKSFVDYNGRSGLNFLAVTCCYSLAGAVRTCDARVKVDGVGLFRINGKAWKHTAAAAVLFRTSDRKFSFG